MSQTRRLAAILAADVAGYSRLMGADGEGTRARLRAHFGKLSTPKIPEHSGRVTERNAHCQEYPGPMRLCARAPPSRVP